jgi:hypothetical protein
MNLESAMKNGKKRLEVVARTEGLAPVAEEARSFHERELRFVAAFRLRDAANRVATLVDMSCSPQLRAELLAIYERLMEEERELLVRSMEVPRLKPGRVQAGAARP